LPRKLATKIWYCQKFYEKQGNNMKPQSYTVFDVEL
jgi:hypothetical protein